MPCAMTAASTIGISLITRNGMNAARPNVMSPTTTVLNSASPLLTVPSPGFPVAPIPPSAPRPTANAIAIASFENTNAANSSITRRRTDAIAGHTLVAHAIGASATTR